MAERDQLGRALGGEDAGGAGDTEDIALGRVTALDRAQRGRAHPYDGARDGLARGFGLGRDIHHAGIAPRREVRETSEAVGGDGSRRAPSLGRTAPPATIGSAQAVTPERPVRRIASMRSLAINFSFLSSLIRQC